MAGTRVPERVDLIAAGVAPARVRWGGGSGVVICHVAGSIAAAPLEMECDGFWVPVKDIATGVAISFSAIGMFNFILPATFLRLTGGTITGASAMAVGTGL